MNFINYPFIFYLLVKKKREAIFRNGALNLRHIKKEIWTAEGLRM